MATRFGGASPTYAYTIKVRYIVAGLFCVILVLAITLIYVLQRQTEPTAPIADADSFSQQPVSAAPKTEVLVAQQRIEEGTPLDKSLFTSLSWDAETLPEGVILWREADAVLPNKFAKNIITANIPVTREQITDQRPSTSIKIPPGFRAITITVDSRSGVEGWARPNSRVDVLCTYTDSRDNQKKIGTVVRFVKILSVSGQTQSLDGRAAVGAEGGVTTVTLLVEEQSARKVELARQLGSLSLSLVGEQETAQTKDQSGPLSGEDIFGTTQQPIAPKAQVPVEGRMTIKDPKTGRPVVMVLQKGVGWVREDSVSQ